MGLRGYADIDDSRLHYSTSRKLVTVQESLRRWYDDSMLPGYPPASFYTGAALTAQATIQAAGIRHAEPDPATREHLLSVCVTGDGGSQNGPQQFWLCDYLLYYPDVDGETANTQVMDNTVTLPRSTSGEGVRAFIVTTGITTGGSRTFTVTYTNERGETGRTVSSGAAAMTVTQILGGDVSGIYQSPFLPLQDGDRGVRAIESITFNGVPQGGTFAIVLAKPIVSFAYADNSGSSETTFPHLPLIPDGACLHTFRLTGTLTSNNRFFANLYTTIRS